jgi:transposase
VHKDTVVACRLGHDASGERVSETRTFSTMTLSILTLSDWLREGDCTDVAMESTSVYWKPIYYLLEGQFDLVLVNPAHIKAFNRDKTDRKDAEWIAQLLEHGLLKSSFVPPAPQRELRLLTRERANFVRQRATLVNRVHKLLEDANIKLASVATDVLGKSGRAMLYALVRGETDAAMLAEMAKGRLRNKQALLEQALEGRVKGHHRLILGELLGQIDNLEESIARFDAAIEEACAPFGAAVAHLKTIPGVSQTTAELIVSEVGTDMSAFKTDGHLCSWAGVAPGNHESGGKRLSGRTRQGNQALRAGLVQAAHAAARTKNTYLSTQYHRLAGRRGKKRAIMAVAHTILVIAYHLISKGEDYKELGADYFDKQRPDAAVKRNTAQLEKLGYKVSLEPIRKAA